MIVRLLMIILALLCLGCGAMAQDQVPQALSTPPEQWQLTLDVIKSKAQSLVMVNNGLQDQYRQLREQAQKFQQAISEQQSKNEQLERYLKERHGRTDQQVRIDELTRLIREKNQESHSSQERLGNLQAKQSSLDTQIQKLKYTISDLELHQQRQKQLASGVQNAVALQPDDQLGQLRKELEDENKREVLLENELGALKTGDKSQNLYANAVETENKQLEARLDVLRLQKLQHDKESSDKQLSQASARMYNHLIKRKEELESSIYAYELRMDQLRQSSLMSLSWPLKKKKLIHEMVQVDARNNQRRDKIKVLREDIALLKDQVAKLERKVDFARGKPINY